MTRPDPHASYREHVSSKAEAVEEKDISTLLPCPFCGTSATAKMYGRDMLFKVECNGCGAEVRGYDQCQQDAVDGWNARVDAELLRAQLATARKVVDAACRLVAADTYKHPILSREDAVKAGVAELHDAVGKWHGAQPAALNSGEQK